MIDFIVDRRELKAEVARVLRHMLALDAPAEQASSAGAA
jgi:acetyl-CoA carboxylase beta subunit